MLIFSDSWTKHNIGNGKAMYTYVHTSSVTTFSITLPSNNTGTVKIRVAACSIDLTKQVTGLRVTLYNGSQYFGGNQKTFTSVSVGVIDDIIVPPDMDVVIYMSVNSAETPTLNVLVEEVYGQGYLQ